MLQCKIIIKGVLLIERKYIIKLIIHIIKLIIDINLIILIMLIYNSNHIMTHFT